MWYNLSLTIHAKQAPVYKFKKGEIVSRWRIVQSMSSALYQQASGDTSCCHSDAMFSRDWDLTTRLQYFTPPLLCPRVTSGRLLVDSTVLLNTFLKSRLHCIFAHFCTYCENVYLYIFSNHITLNNFKQKIMEEYKIRIESTRDQKLN